MEPLAVDDEAAIGRRSRRVAVSAEPCAPRDLNNRVKKVVPKSDNAIARIDAKLKTNFLFTNLDEDGRKELCDAVSEVKYAAGDVIIKQGAVGDNFYILETGTCDIYIGDRKVMECKPGDSFGELALMYNAPRAASVVATSNAECWVMDRLTFKLTLMESTLKKRERYEAFLEDVPILASLLPYERLTIADALRPEEFVKGNAIVNQGDDGDKFYILESGACDFILNGAVVGEVESGGYFGELALLHNQPRAVSVIVTSAKAKVLALDRATFTGVMGPLHQILKRNGDTYAKFMAGAK